MTEAAKLFNQVALRCFEQWGFITTFREVSKRGIEKAAGDVHGANVAFMQTLLTDPSCAEMIVDKERFIKEGLHQRLVRDMTEKSLVDTVTAINAACLVFAHSVVDGVALDYCKVTALASPTDWESSVESRQVTLKAARSAPYDELLRAALDSFFKQLEQESLLKKVDLLFQRCAPPQGFWFVKDFKYDPERLRKVDRLRQEIIHGDALLRGIADADADADIVFLRNTTMHLMGLVNHRYDCRIDVMYQTELIQRRC